MDKLLRRDILNPANEPGATSFEQVANSLKRSETFTPDLIRSLREAGQGEMNKAERHPSN